MLRGLAGLSTGHKRQRLPCGGGAAADRTYCTAAQSSPCPAALAMPLAARPRADVPRAPASSWPAPRQPLAPHRLRLLAPCRITNTSEEVFKMVERGIDFQDPNVYKMKNYQVHHPDQGPLEHRVRRMYLDALTDDIVDMEETNYWFAQPDGGWQNEAERIEGLEPAPVPFANPEHTPEENGWETRFELDEIEEGTDLVGVVTDLWLYHGIQVDVHCQYDGLIALREADWELIGSKVMPGDILCVRVHKKRKPGLYRWPLQLAVYDKEDAEVLMDPNDYVPSINHDWAANNGMSIDEIAKAAGRPYEAQSFFWRQADDEWAEEVNEALGYDVDFVEDEIEPEDDLAPEWATTREGRVLDIASSLAAGGM